MRQRQLRKELTMELLLAALAVIVFDLVALLRGADSRPSIDDRPYQAI